MKFRDCTQMNLTEISRTALEFENCKQQLITLTMCLPACLCAQIARTPFNYTITARTRLARLIPQFPALGKNCRIASMLIITRALSTPRDVERRERGSMFWETNHFLTILSKSNYRVRLDVNMIIGDSTSIHFNFGKGYYFFLWMKQQIFDKARFF